MSKPDTHEMKGCFIGLPDSVAKFDVDWGEKGGREDGVQSSPDYPPGATLISLTYLGEEVVVSPEEKLQLEELACRDLGFL